MKKTNLILICIFILGVNSLLAGEKLKVSVPPSIWAQQADNKLTGPIFDLLGKLFADLNVEIKPEILPWSRAVEHMKSGDLDMIPVIFYSAERAEFMGFSIPYIRVPTSVFVPLGRSFHFNRIQDLTGKRGLMMRDDSISPEFERTALILTLEKVTNYHQILRMLDDNRADYAVAAHYGFLIEAKKLGMVHRFEVLPKPIASRSLHIAVSKKSPFLRYLPLINQKLLQFQADGTTQRMIDRAIRQAAGK